jgi:CRISPR-associated protein Csy2
MSALIILRHIRVENANAIAGLTYGFPAISHFLGYTHALSRKLKQSHGLTLDGCGVVCHKHQLHAHQSGWDRGFALTRNPLTKEASTAPFNEEGRMHMTVSLLIECTGMIADGDEGARALAQHLQLLCVGQKLAGGSIIDIRDISVIAFPESQQQIRALMYRLLPGYVLVDRSAFLQQQLTRLKQSNPQAEMIDAWLDFCALKMRAVKGNESEGNKISWDYQPKPESGYLVPLTTGYRAISSLYPAGTVEKSRDPQTPFRFVESIYGLGEWRGAHRIHDIQEILWQYDDTDGWYLCRSRLPVQDDTYELNDDE